MDLLKEGKARQKDHRYVQDKNSLSKSLKKFTK